MKIKAITLILLFASSFAFSQELSKKELKKHLQAIETSKEKGTSKISLDTLFCAGEAMCLTRVFGNMAGKTCILSDFQGNEIATISIHNTVQNQDPYRQIYFNETGQSVYYPNAWMEDVFDKLCGHRVIKDGVVDQGNYERFIATSGSSEPPPILGQVTTTTVQYGYQQNQSGYNNNTVDRRNRNANIMVFGSTLKQDNKVIGTFSSDRNAVQGGIEKSITIYDANGGAVALATTNGSTAHNWTITTYKDNKQHYVNSSLGHDEEDIAAYLSRLLYL